MLRLPPLAQLKDSNPQAVFDDPTCHDFLVPELSDEKRTAESQ
jgi:hypothetical protein